MQIYDIDFLIRKIKQFSARFSIFTNYFLSENCFWINKWKIRYQYINLHKRYIALINKIYFWINIQKCHIYCFFEPFLLFYVNIAQNNTIIHQQKCSQRINHANVNQKKNIFPATKTWAIFYFDIFTHLFVYF